MNFFLPKEITVGQIEDFFNYSEVSRWLGQTDNTKQFGHSIQIECTREKAGTIYHGIYLAGEGESGYISIENGEVKYRYAEQTYISVVTASIPTNDKKVISLLNKGFFRWYNRLKLPDSIQTIQNKKKDTISVVREIKIDGFDDKFPPVLRVLNNKTTYLVFGVFPPRSKKLTKQQTDNFDKLLANATGKKVVHEDRELFVIFDDSQKMTDDIVSFLQNSK